MDCYFSKTTGEVGNNSQRVTFPNTGLTVSNLNSCFRKLVNMSIITLQMVKISDIKSENIQACHLRNKRFVFCDVHQCALILSVCPNKNQLPLRCLNGRDFIEMTIYRSSGLGLG